MSENFNITRDQVHCCLLYDFRSGVKPNESFKKLCEAFGENVISQRTVYNWFNKFKQGKYNLKDEPRSGRPSELDNDQLIRVIEENPNLTTREMESILGCDHTTIARHLASLGKVCKYGSWVPHDLSAEQRQTRLNVCLELLSRRRTTNWLDNLITGDEKWVFYHNVTRKKQWLEKGETAKPIPKNYTHEKVMCCVWWDIKGVIMFELLPKNQTVTAQLYTEQLQRLAQNIKEKRKNHEHVFFLHDNARPHVAKITRHKLLELGWEILPHPPYSPDLAPTDFYLFRSLQNYLNGKQFQNIEDIEENLKLFFQSKSEDFYRQGVHALPHRWRQVIDLEGDYITE